MVHPSTARAREEGPATGAASRLERLRRLVGQRDWRSGYALLLLILASAVAESFGLALIMPILSVMSGDVQAGSWGGAILDGLRTWFPGEASLFFALLGGMLGLLLVKNVLIIWRTAFSARFTRRILARWMAQIFERYVRAPYGFILNNEVGALANNAVREPQLASQAISAIIDFAARVVLVVFLFACLLATNWRATLLVFGVCGTILVLTRRQLDRYTRAYGKERLRLQQQMSSQVTECVSGVRQVKAFGLEGFVLGQFGERLERFARISETFLVMKALPTSIGEVLMAAIVLGLVALMYGIMGVSLQGILPFLGMFVVISHRIAQNLMVLVGQRMTILSMLPALRLVEDITSRPMEGDGARGRLAVEGVPGDIEFQDVEFSYGDKPVLRDFSIRIPRGGMTALIGPSGAGKSTVADLLLGLYRPTGGRILVGGRDLADLELASWRARIGFVSQDVFMFNTTVAENIALGRIGADAAAIREAARLAEAHEFIMDLPQGYDTVIGDRGLKLSGGQRQRIALARALVRDPDLFIFDEATSALDAETEKAIQKSIEKLAPGKTLVVIAHRLSTIENADVVYDLGALPGTDGKPQGRTQ